MILKDLVVVLEDLLQDAIFIAWTWWCHNLVQIVNSSVFSSFAFLIFVVIGQQQNFLMLGMCVCNVVNMWWRGTVGLCNKDS